ncbi:MAG: ArdC-like ssDNA-binding domain-containing protein [Eubacteriales bacterium]|nr:ArdC-like ssDNA-binding domain-containing protein [Eubacteriales bacterium]
MANKYTLTNEQRQQQIKDLTEQLEEGVRSVFESERYAQYLQVMSKFTHYSVNNTILIAMQTGGQASMVAGYAAWQKNFGRQVNRGEKAIKILAPMTYQRKKEVDMIDPASGQPLRNPDGSVQKEIIEVTVPSFRVTNVFDISQTSGPPLPSIVDTLEGNVERYEDFVKAIRSISPVPLTFEQMEGKDGYYHQIEKRIAINADMSEIQTMAAMIHELAHAKIHALDPDHLKESAKARGKDQRTMEVEAESIAAVVSSYFGIDTSANSWGYVASWSRNKELPELTASLQVIKDTAGEIIAGISEEMEKYRPLAKVEEMEEQNYNMIDNVLNNGFGEKERREAVRLAAVRYQEETGATMTFYAAICEEFHSMQACYEGLTLEEAVEKYKEIREDPRLAYYGNAMGVEIHDESLEQYDGYTFPLVEGSVIKGSNLDYVKVLAAHPMAKEALELIREAFSEYRFVASEEIKESLYPKHMTAEELAGAILTIGKGFDAYELMEGMENTELALAEIKEHLLAGDGMKLYVSFLKDVQEESRELSPRAEALRDRVREFTQDLSEERETEAVRESLPVARETALPKARPVKEKTSDAGSPKKSIHARLQEKKKEIANKPEKGSLQKGVELA